MVKHPPASAGDLDLPWVGKSLEKGSGGLQSRGWQKCQTCCSDKTVRTWTDSQLSFYFNGVGPALFLGGERGCGEIMVHHVSSDVRESKVLDCKGFVAVTLIPTDPEAGNRR